MSRNEAEETASVVFFISSSFLYINRIGGVMVSLLASSAVD